MSVAVASPVPMTPSELLARPSTSSARPSQAPSAFPPDGPPQQSPSPPSSRTSSLRRRTSEKEKGKARDDAGAVNPIHALAHRPGEVHIVKATGDTVALAPAAPHEGLAARVGRALTPVLCAPHDEPISPPSVTGAIGPPPPSPPASIHTFEDAVQQVRERHQEKPEVAGRVVDDSTDYAQMPPPTPPPKGARPVTFDVPVERASSVDSRDSAGYARPSRHLPRHAVASLPAPGPSALHRAATDTRTSLSTTSSAGTTTTTTTTAGSTAAGSLSTRTPPTEDSLASASAAGSKAAHLSADGYLQPPPLLAHRNSPRRRNTTGSALAGAPKPHRPAPGGSMGLGYAEDPDGDGELANDIERQAEQIRMERQSRREKWHRAADAALTRSMSKEERQQVLVGNLIGEDHVNYVMMYNMLTGIRIAVSSGVG
jgi:1-phosphatidylinositol-4-phosphate 5-kinase